MHKYAICAFVINKTQLQYRAVTDSTFVNQFLNTGYPTSGYAIVFRVAAATDM